MTFADFFASVKEAKFGFDVIWEAIVSLYYAMTANPDISNIWNGMMAAIEPARSMIMTVLVVLSVVVAMFGKKMIGFLKFLFFFIVGFAIGTHLLATLIPADVNIKAWLIGLIIAIVAGVLYRFLYIVLYSVTVGYGAYILLYNGFFISESISFTVGRALVCLAIAAVVLLFAFLFKRFVEMIGTAALGGWLASSIFAKQIYDFTQWGIFGNARWVAILIPTLIIAILGAFIQIKTRRRY